MRRRSLLAIGGTALTTALAGCSAMGTSGDNGTNTPTHGGTNTPSGTTDAPGTPAKLVNGSFESDWRGWTVGRHLPEDPNREGTQSVASAIGVTTRDATDGTTSLALRIDGSQDDGTVWVGQRVDRSGYDHLAVDYTVSRSFNHIRDAAVYVGPEPDGPLTEADFDTSNSLEGHDAAGWRTFVYDVSGEGIGYVAVGFSVVWETHTGTLLDNVRLTAGAPETVTPTPATSTAGSGIESGSGSASNESTAE